jgi:hypothetical protein
VAPPFRSAEFDIIFGEGISKTGEIIDMGVELGVLQKSGSWYSYNSDKLGQGRDGVRQLLIDNPQRSTSDIINRWVFDCKPHPSQGCGFLLTSIHNQASWKKREYSIKENASHLLPTTTRRKN